MWAASQLFPAFQWENCLFGHFIFPLDCLVAHMPIHHSRLCCWLRLRCYVVSVVCILYMLLYCLICLFCLDVLRCLCFLKRLELWKRYIKQTCCCYNKQVMWSQHGGGHEPEARFMKNKTAFLEDWNDLGLHRMWVCITWLKLLRKNDWAHLYSLV